MKACKLSFSLPTGLLVPENGVRKAILLLTDTPLVFVFAVRLDVAWALFPLEN